MQFKATGWYLLYGLCSVFLCSIANVIYASSDKVVAIVNDHVITQSEVDTRCVALQQHLMQASVALSGKRGICKKVLQELIDMELQLQTAKRNNIQVSEQIIDQEIADIASRNHITVTQLQAELQKQGIKYQDFRKQMRNNILLNKVEQAAVSKKIVISDEEVASVLRSPPTAFISSMQSSLQAQTQEYNAVDVLIPVKEQATASEIAAAKSVAQNVVAKLRQGKEIAEVLKDPSFTDKTLPLVSNDLGWRHLPELPNIFIASVAKLKPQEVAAPIIAPNGIHVIKLLAVRGGDGGTHQATKITADIARAWLYREKFQQALQPWLKQLRATAYIKIVDEGESANTAVIQQRKSVNKSE